MLVCPGLYCDPRVGEDAQLPDCDMCTAAVGDGRMNDSWLCRPCSEHPSPYDWCYLLFMAVVPLLCNCFFIDISVSKKAYRYLLFHFSAFLESTISFLFSLFIFPPFASLSLLSCAGRDLSDWYSLFSTSPSNTGQHCVYESVFPLYSIVFVMHVSNLSLTIIFRSLLSHLTSLPTPCSLYGALFLHPLLALLHALFAGFIYYSYPYIIIITTMITNASHLGSFKEKTPLGMLREFGSSSYNVGLQLIHSLLLLFAISALLFTPPFRLLYPLLTLVPLPPLISIFTSPFTQPYLLQTSSPP